MKRYLLDTGILVHIARQSTLYKRIENEHKLGANDVIPMISVVSYGEILAFARQRNWGAKKQQEIRNILGKLIIIDINSGDNQLMEAYADIDAFSKNKLQGHQTTRSAIKMGKNDLWIAATAKIAKAKLLTTDSDFDHLDSFIEVFRYN
ncbi:MAG TPA: PIN domain-containing protein [Chitinophaga sp.]